MGLAISKKKSVLVKKGEQFKSSLKNDLNIIKENSKDIATNGAVVIGIVSVAFIVYKILSSSSSHEEISYGNDDSKVVVVNSEPSNSVFRSVLNSITLFLLNIAKDKLLAQLDKKEITKSE